jgi:glycosyltransferase involved in cell wall biosynthesis
MTSRDHGFGIIFPHAAGAGFAMRTLEQAFRQLGETLAQSAKNVHVIFGEASSLDTELRDGPVETFAWGSQTPEALERLASWIQRHRIETIFGLDLPVSSGAYPIMRRAGVRGIVSYWGAPMSSINHGAKLLAKRWQVAMAADGPDHYIFESEAMRATAVAGRGIPASATSVVPTGIDHMRFCPSASPSSHAHAAFGIPTDRHIVIYSGHFEARKGVAVLIECARHLVLDHQCTQLHFLLCGNRGNEADVFAQRLRGTPAEEFVTFAGYRSDIVQLYQSAWVGCIASTGWDSFPMSALEMQAAGLPIFVSALQGIPETIDNGRTGFSFPPGDHVTLARRLLDLAADEPARTAMSRQATDWISNGFTREHQYRSLLEVTRQVMLRCQTPWHRVDANGVVER